MNNKEKTADEQIVTPETEAAETVETAAAEASAADTAEKNEDTTHEDGGKKDKKDTKKLRESVRKLEEEKAALEATLAEANDRLLRMAAEFDNFKKRSQKEREGIYSDAVADTVKELLPLMDNMERAAAYAESDPAKVAEGVSMILKTFPEVLAKLGVAEEGEKGKKFDPNLHNAVMHVEDEAFGEEEIVEVFQKGYIRGDKVIRYAMVKVAN